MKSIFIMLTLYNIIMLLTVAVYGGSSGDDTTRTREPIYLLTLLPYPDVEMPQFNPSLSVGPNLIPALDLAVEQIRNRTDLLENYELGLLHSIEGCEFLVKTHENIIRSMFEDHTDKNIVGIIGPTCSLSTIAVADLTARRELSLVSIHDSGSPLLSNAAKYKYTLGAYGSTVRFVNTLLLLMNINSWHKIAVLYQNSRAFYRTTLQQLESTLKFRKEANNNVPEIVFSSPISDTFYPLTDVKESGAKIVLVLVAEEHLLKIMCLAWSNLMILPFYQWLIMIEHFDFLFAANESDFVEFRTNDKQYNCSIKDIRFKALHGSILINFRLTMEPSNKDHSTCIETDTCIGLSFNTFNTLYEQRVTKYNNRHLNQNLKTTILAHNLYDTVWAWAFVLNRLASRRGMNLSSIQYGEYTKAEMIMEEFFALNFTGMSGEMSFNNSTRYVDRIVDVYQVLNGNGTLVAYSDSSNNLIKEQIILAIKDPFSEAKLAHPGLIGFFGAVVAVLFVVMVILHILTLVYRNFQTIKASSIQLNQFIFIGVYLLFVGLVLFLVSERLRVSGKVVLCQTVWAWMLPMSLSLIYGTLVGRTWRLYRIFIHYLDPGPFITTPILAGFVFFLLAIDIGIAIVWTLIDPLHVIIVEYRGSNKLETTTRCWCKYYHIWQATIILYKTIIMILFFTLAHLTGNIKQQSFTTASLRVLGYMKFILYLLGLPMYAIFNTFSRNPNADSLTFCLLVTVSVALIIGLIFLPPILPIFQKKASRRDSEPHVVSRLQ